MRWSYILPRVIFLALVWAFSVFAFDPLLKLGMIKGLEKAAGAKVEIASVKTTFLDPSLKITGLAVASADAEFTNAAEFSDLSFSASGRALLEKKLLVENASLSGLKFGTPRKTSGKLPAALIPAAAPETKPSDELVQSVKQEAQNFAVERKEEAKADLAADYKVNPDDLESVKLAKQLEADYNENYKNIEQRLDVKKYQARIDEITAKYNKAKAEGNPLKQAKDYAEVAKDLKKLNADFKKDKEEVQAALDKAKDAFKQLDEARKRDTAAVMAKMKLPSMDAQSLARLLAGPVMAERTAQAMRWMALAKKYMPSNSKGVLKNEAPRGREVHFPKDHAYPTVLIKRLAITGELGAEDPLDYSGEILGLTTQPSVYGRPTTAELKGAKGARRLFVKAALDATGDDIRTESTLAYTGMAVNGLKLGSEASFQLAVTGATGAVDAAMKTKGDELDGKAELKLTGAKFVPSADKIKAAPLRSAVQNAFAGLNSGTLSADITGTLKAPKLAVKTDLADALSKAFSKAMGDEVKKAQAEAQKKIDDAIKPYREKLDNLTASKKAELEARSKAAEDKLSSEGEKIGKSLTPAPGKLKLPKIKL